MDQKAYTEFLKDPAGFLNSPPAAYGAQPLHFTTGLNIGPDPQVHSELTANKSLQVFHQASNAKVIRVYLQYRSQDHTVWAGQNDPAPPKPAAPRPDAKATSSAQEQPRVQDTAYYLPWAENQTHAISLGTAQSLFITPNLTGCGILVFETPQGLTVLHHNVQMPEFRAKGRFESPKHYEAALNKFYSDENRCTVKTRELASIAREIIDGNPDIRRGAALDLNQYLAGGSATVFGIRGEKGWRLFANHKNIGQWRTDLLFA